MIHAIPDQPRNAALERLVETGIETPQRRVEHVPVTQRAVQPRPPLLHLPDQHVHGPVLELQDRVHREVQVLVLAQRRPPAVPRHHDRRVREAHRQHIHVRRRVVTPRPPLPDQDRLLRQRHVPVQSQIGAHQRHGRVQPRPPPAVLSAPPCPRTTAPHPCRPAPPPPLQFIPPPASGATGPPRCPRPKPSRPATVRLSSTIGPTARRMTPLRRRSRPSDAPAESTSRHTYAPTSVQEHGRTQRPPTQRSHDPATDVVRPPSLAPTRAGR